LHPLSHGGDAMDERVEEKEKGYDVPQGVIRTSDSIDNASG
jgi:hypothetical protein